MRTMGAYTAGGADLVWYGAAGDRTNVSISAFGILDDFRRVLVRDDFGDTSATTTTWPACGCPPPDSTSPPRTTARNPRSAASNSPPRVQGCWRTLATLQRHCRIRTYLVSARNHGRRPIDAIRDALTANPWMPPQAA